MRVVRARSGLVLFLFAGIQTAGDMMKPLSTLSLALLLPGVALATEGAAPTLVVSASRLPETAGIDSSHVQTIDAGMIRRSGARDVTTLLRQVAVVQLVDTVGDGSGGSLGMRGFGENGGQNVLVLLDGRRLNNDSDLAPPELRNLSIDDIDHIEIINGSAGALYGSGAVGGIVNIVTRPLSRQLRVGASRGSHDYEAYRLRAGERQGEMGVQLVAEKATADNYRERNEMDRGFVQGRVTFDLDSFGFFAEASRFNLDQNLAGSLSAAQLQQDRRQAQYPADFTHTRSDRYSAGTRIELGPDWRLTVDGSIRQDGSVGELTGLDYVQARDQRSVSPRLNGQLRVGEQALKVVAGFDRDDTDYRFRSPFGPIRTDMTVSGHYLQLGWAPAPALELVLAGRHAELDSEVSDGFTYPTGKDIDDGVDLASFAVYLQPAPGLRAWLRADENFRFATADEQIMRPFGVFTPLETQTGLSLEAGLRLQENRWQAGLQVYQLRLEREISYDPIQFANVNLDDTRRDGVTAQLGLQLADALRLGAQLALVDAEFTSGPNNGKRIPFVARDTETLDLTWSTPWKVDASLEQQRLGRRHPSGDYGNVAAKLPSLYLANLALTWQWKGLLASARVNNLLDKRYNTYSTQTWSGTAYVPAPERNLLFSVDYLLP